VAPPPRPPAPVDAPYVDLRATSPDSDSEPSRADIDLSESSRADIDLTEPRPADVDPTPAAPVPAHQVELMETGSFTHAACSACGWTGPARRSRAIALADLGRHP
jgi:hypothetical protein